MKKQLSMRAAVVRNTRIAAASAAFALLAACGGGGDDNSTPAGGLKLQVVSFGDSLSDVGTYSPVAAANFGGGRFTTNPGEVWVQNVAKYYGDTLTPAMSAQRNSCSLCRPRWGKSVVKTAGCHRCSPGCGA